jgi:hypothetical protein
MRPRSSGRESDALMSSAFSATRLTQRVPWLCETRLATGMPFRAVLTLLRYAEKIDSHARSPHLDTTNGQTLDHAGNAFWTERHLRIGVPQIPPLRLVTAGGPGREARP